MWKKSQCEVCGKDIPGSGSSVCSDACSFWKKVYKNGEGGCWIWKSVVDKKKRPVFFFLGQTRMMFAHRYAYQQMVRTLEKGEILIRKCGNSLCCNPDHMTVGGAKERVALAGKVPREDRNVASKIKADDVLAIRKDSRRNTEIALEYGISPAQVGAIRSGKCWRHVGGDLTPRNKHRRGRSVLTEEQVVKVKSYCGNGRTYSQIAGLFGVSESTVCRIAKGNRWGDVGLELVK